MTTDVLATALIQYVALLLALTVHEFTHAALAAWLGDDTAAAAGRLTLNPLPHVDPVGTVLLPALGMLTAFPLFGWARPVPVQPRNFRRGWYARGQVLVAAGGPLSNLAQALFWVFALSLLTRLVSVEAATGTPLEVLAAFMAASVFINLILMAFNFLPLPPLDGAHLASWGLPRHLAVRYDAFVGRYGIAILVLLFLPILAGTSPLRLFLTPFLRVGEYLVGPPWMGW